MAQPYALKALGLINALGSQREEVKRNLQAGLTTKMRKDSMLLRDRDVIVGAIDATLPSLSPTHNRLNSRNGQLLRHAFQQIERDVKACIKRFGPHRIGVVIGSSTSGIAEGERASEHHFHHGSFPEDYHYAQQELGSASELVALLAGTRGPALTISTACTSSARAFASARNLLSMGVCDAVIVGGSDSLCRLTLRGFGALSALSQGHCNPMSKHRDGINIGEAAALFLMTHSEDPHDVCLWGIGESSDAHHISAPDPSGKGAQVAIAQALADADITPKDIGYINLHGTSTKLNDAMESKAVAAIFHSENPDVPCSSTKPLVGHTLGAAGATEAAFCWLTLQELIAHQTTAAAVPLLPPHRWDGVADEELPALCLVDEGTRWLRTDAPYCISHSFAFGGNNCVLVLGPRQREPKT